MARENVCTDEGSAFYGMSRPSIAPKQHFSAIEHAHNVMGAGRSLADRVQTLVAKLVGPWPEEANDGRPCHGPGIFPSLHDVSDETGYAIRKANKALDRLEKELA